jgi:hypothetical protein
MQTIEKKVLGLVGLTAVLVVVVLVVLRWQNNRQKPAQTILPARFAFENKILPKNFPEDFPQVDLNQKTLQNEEVDVMGKKQAKRQFLSEKSLPENYTLYKQYLLEKQWQILADVNNDLVKTLIAQKNNQNFIITLTTDPESQKVLVNATVEY